MEDLDRHWRSLPTDSWEFRDRDNTNYRFTDNQLDYFKEFSDTSYSNWQMQNEIIPDALDNLPARIEDLSEDISFLEQAGETTEDLWESMLNIDQRAGHINDVPFGSQKEPENQAVQLGYEIGSMIELIMSGFASKDDRTDVARGFVLAFCGEAGEGIDEDRITALEFAELLAEKHPPQKLWTLEDVKTAQKSVGVENPIGSGILDALKQRGVAYSTYLSDMLEGEAEKTYNRRSVSNAKGDVEVDFEIYEVSAEEGEMVVDAFLQSHPEIKDFDELHESLSEDTKLIDVKEKFGTPTDEVVEHLWKAEKGYSGSKLNAKINTNTSLPHTTNALHSLSAGYNDELWTNRPIVVNLSDGWELTDYGNLIAYLLVEVDKNVTGPEVQDFIDDPDINPDKIASLDFDVKLRELLHRTAISPATVDSKFVNLVKKVHENNGSCVDWRNRVSGMSNQD